MSVPVTALGMASFRHLEIDSALRATFDWWSEAELRDIEPEVSDMSDWEPLRRMDDLGRVVIPNTVRQELGIAPYSLLLLTVEDGKIVLTPQQEPHAG